MEAHLQTPHFRIFFAIQQAVLLQKNLNTQLQIYVRTSLPETFKLQGSFSAFVLLLRAFLQLSARSYEVNQSQKLIFVTTDLLNNKIILRITAGGSLLQQPEALVQENLPETQQLLSESIHTIQKDFHGKFELVNFPHRGMQVIITLPTQIYSQTRDTS